MITSCIAKSDSVLHQATATLMMQMEVVQHQGLSPGGGWPRSGGPREWGRGVRGEGDLGVSCGHRGRAVAVMVDRS